MPAFTAETCWHGFDPVTQTCPAEAFPPAIPLTCTVTFWFCVLFTCTVKVCRWPTLRVDVAGARDMLMADV